MVRNCLPASLLSLTTVAPAADFAHGTQPFEARLGVALERQSGRVVKVEFKEAKAGHRDEFDIQGSGLAQDVARELWPVGFE